MFIHLRRLKYNSLERQRALSRATSRSVKGPLARRVAERIEAPFEGDRVPRLHAMAMPRETQTPSDLMKRTSYQGAGGGDPRGGLNPCRTTLDPGTPLWQVNAPVTRLCPVRVHTLMGIQTVEHVTQ